MHWGIRLVSSGVSKIGYGTARMVWSGGLVLGVRMWDGSVGVVVGGMWGSGLLSLSLSLSLSRLCL